MVNAISPITPEFSVPYLTLNEFKQAPSGIDYDDLVIGGNVTAQDSELLNAITRASSWIDQFCNQQLTAIVRTDQTRVRVGQDGMLRWAPNNSPMIALISLSYGSTPNNLTVVSDVSTAWMDGSLITYPMSGLSISGIQSGFSLGSAGIGKYVYINYSYISGFVNTQLSALQIIGDSSITLVNPNGVIPNQMLNIFDGANSETIQVSSSYVFGSSPVTLAHPLTKAHSIGACASAVPSSIKEAAILMTTVFLQTRGDHSLTMRIGTSGEENQGVNTKINSNMDLAKTLLQTYRRIR